VPAPTDLPDIVIPPGGFYQINEVLWSNALSLASGYVRVERVSGLAPYYAYAVINNQLSSDGSFVAPMPEDSQTNPSRLTVPLDVRSEPNSSLSEWVLTNLSSSDMQLRLYSAAVALFYGDPESYISTWLRPGEQRIFRPDRTFDALSSVRPVVIDSEVYYMGLSQLYVGVRVLGRERDLRYGFSYAGIPSERESQKEAWLFGLQQNPETRTNLVLVNLANEATTFDLELFDGETGLRAGMVQLAVGSRISLQVDSLLATHAPGVTQGYARVVAKQAGPFVAHAIILDGAQPGERSGDGSVIYSTP
jgi:hypothetical protein